MATRVLVVAPVLCLATTALSADVELVPAGSVWKYLDDGTNQGTAWRAPDFDDGAWDSGPSELGYGDGDEATELSFGPDPDNKYTTYYFRHEFEVADPGAFNEAIVRVLRDDGAVAYLNGEEIFRTNMPSGTITWQTFAASTISGSEEHEWHEHFVAASELAQGTNVLAIELHQRTLTSSDISLDVEVIGNDGLPSVTRGPYLQRSSPVGLTVRWRTSSPTDTRFLWGPAPDELINESSSAAVTTDHFRSITGLEPSTTYYYAIGTSAGIIGGGDDEHYFKTSPPAGTAVPTRIWILGDSGTADEDAAAVRDAYYGFTGTEHTDLLLMLGDNAYNDGTDEQYQVAVFDMYETLLVQTPLWPTLGNHDAHSADSPSQSGPYYQIFTLPQNGEVGGVPSGTEAYYSFDYGNIHFICLDSADTSLSGSSPMWTWLENDIGDTLLPWIVAFWHHPPYSKGSHDSDSEGDLIDMREEALPILEAGGVDLVLCGHSHSYERSVLLDGHYGHSSTLVPSMILDGGDGDENGDGAYETMAGPNHGTVYAVAGSSGKTSDGPLDHPVMVVALEELGSMVLDVEDLRLDATFLDDNGVVRDSFTILKEGMSADITGDGLVNVADLLAVILDWGPCSPGPCPADTDGDGVVGLLDLIDVIVNWTA